MPTEMTRIETMTDAERTLVGILTPIERKRALVESARGKQRANDGSLRREQIDRVKSGELQPQTLNAYGDPFPTNGRTVYYQAENESLTDLGRVPDYEGIHVLQKRDGSLFFTGGFNLREEGERWEDLDDMGR